MMLKPSGSSRIQRSKTLKVKHALQICVILTICIWFLYQVKKSHNKKAALEERPAGGETKYQIVTMGRKDLKPRMEEFENQGDEEVELEDEETRVERVIRDRDEEIGMGDNEKSEDVEHDQLQDVMDDDVKDTDVNKLL
ncbi:hypothetical protein CDL12_19060 [Handroanthus impetiginosus]|uniref:Uncharacterized protein n=1 Tax=Handroanthus impetiginosus TaxID=429701 RepID=A0A2G9GKK9_9LAMI|nr:hypothetical protein CDL12_21713 [Handroanthus impetiginosus]PIN08359.1 hypothetical protein CDL12_19060 [Handroanthus impetiginosus]